MAFVKYSDTPLYIKGTAASLVDALLGWRIADVHFSKINYIENTETSPS
jgi:hypothetical protein